MRGADEFKIRGGTAIPGGHMDKDFHDNMVELIFEEKMRVGQIDKSTLADVKVIVYKVCCYILLLRVVD